MFIRTFVIAKDDKEAIYNSEDFKKVVSKCILDLEIEKVEQYWKFPELYCVEYSFNGIIKEQLTEMLEELGDSDSRYFINEGEINEFIFSSNTGKIFIDKIDWILINLDKD